MSAVPSPTAGSDLPWDAVVVGAGANGSVAAMVLAEAGLRVLVLEAGPDLSASRALGSEPLNSLRRLAHLSSGRQRLQRHHPGFWKHNPELFVDERQNPYSTPPDAPFLWTRGRQVGGKSLTWGGITLRLSEAEFQAGRRDGHGPAWPIGTAELAPFYDRLETLLGVHGQRDGLPQLPDGRYLPPLPFTPGEKHLQTAIGRELGLPLIHSRGFRLHRPTPAAPWPPSSAQGRSLARALATGRVQLRSGAVVSHLEMDRSGRRAEAVVLVDAASGGRERLAAPLVVLCASTIETVRLLLHSSDAVRSGGLSDPSGSLGRYLMDHISTSRFFSIPAIGAPPEPAELSGAGSCFIPNTVNLEEGSSEAFLRGYGIWAALQRFDPPALLRRRPGEAVGFLIGHGEVLPRAGNRVSLDGSRTDAWDLPIPHIDCRWGTNEAAMVAHMQARMAAVVAAAGGRIRPIEELFVLPVLEPLIRNSLAVRPEPPPPGYYIHELGGARMAESPEEGVVDPWNRCWGAANVLVTDGACWPSAGWQSPTLTEMAITWRACAAAAAGMRRH
ncbi:FAD-dependent oxidoreductase [Aphanothece minutissima]|uniref:GMC oxidoreductase n=1 Tax=Aphanothece cf. minutissima CCALA 015 TaxID=2107695 RepID=A0ABX5F534_9CHRO|nr:GMC family oxidoreductase [Aphanothece minutissima]PSB36429.1 GMC oxidoreductase [Aphanothece cf. minutissima CCALA 015]